MKTERRPAGAESRQPLVGREPELELFRKRWAVAANGDGQVVFVSGEPGIGKSRLVQAFRDEVGQDKTTQVIIRCSSYHGNSAFYPMKVFLEKVIGRTADDGPEETYSKIENLLADFRFCDKSTTALFAALLGVSPPEGRVQLRLTPEKQKSETQAALMAWMTEVAGRRPLLMVWEDLHWADPSTIELANLIVDHVPTAPMLAVFVARPDFSPPWGVRSHVTPVTLSRLESKDAEAIALGVAGGTTLPANLLQRMVDRADGVPLFIEELIKSVLESGVLERVDDRYELVAEHSEGSIPITLHGSLMARLDRLGRAKGLAQLAAVIGRDFSYELLGAIAGRSEKALQGELRQLIDAELIYPRGVPPASTYRFKHALVQDVAYDSLLHRRRAALHATIADAIEVSAGELIGEHAAILAHHYAKSSQPGKAIKHALQAGDNAVRLHARAEATTHFRQALKIAHALPDSALAQKSRIDSILKLASVGSSRDDGMRNAQYLQDAQALAEKLSDQRRLAQVLYWRARLYFVGGDRPNALEYAERSLAISDGIGDEALAAWPVNLMARLLLVGSDFRRASQLSLRSAEQMQMLGNTAEDAAMSAYASAALALLGDFDKALTVADRGVRLALELKDPFTQAAALNYRGIVHFELGNWPDAIREFQQARQIADQVGDAFRVYLVKCLEGHCYSMVGRPDEGRILNEQALAFADQNGTTFHLALIKGHQASTLVQLGERDAAVKMAREALDVSNAEPFSVARAYHILARALHVADPDAIPVAEQAIREAISVSKELHYRPELARAHLTYARMLRAWGQTDRAAQCFDTAISEFRAMAMSSELAQATLAVS